MRVAGFGFRIGASQESLAQAFVSAGGVADAFATVSEKADVPELVALASARQREIFSIDPDELNTATVITQSEASFRRYGTGSVAEATALLAAGKGARLIAPRVVSSDGMATCAIAEGKGE